MLSPVSFTFKAFLLRLCTTPLFYGSKRLALWQVKFCRKPPLSGRFGGLCHAINMKKACSSVCRQRFNKNKVKKFYYIAISPYCKNCVSKATIYENKVSSIQQSGKSNKYSQTSRVLLKFFTSPSKIDSLFSVFAIHLEQSNKHKPIKTNKITVKNQVTR